MSPNRIVCSDGLRSVAPLKVRAHLVVSRALTLFRRFDLAGVPRSRRNAALRLAIDEWAPYADWAGAVLWSASSAAAVWIWEAGRLRALAQVEEDRPTPSAVPESLLLPAAPNVDELQCVRTEEGWLVRRFKDGELQAECFFVRRPTAEEWGAAMLALDAPSAAADAALAAIGQGDGAPQRVAPTQRWESLDSLRSAGAFSFERALMAVGAVLAIATLWLGAETLRQFRIRTLQEAELTAVQAQSEPHRLARQQAFDAADRLRAWAALDSFPSATVMLHAVASSLPAGVVVSEYRLDNGVVRATVSNPGARQTGDIVSRLQDSKIFSSVRVVPSGDPRTLRFELEAAPALAAAGKP